MINFLEETIEEIRRAGHKIEDVVCITDTKHYINWNDFKHLADFKYDASYGIHEIQLELTIILNNGTWLERREYDGKEWWVHCTAPTQPKEYGLTIDDIRTFDS